MIRREIDEMEKQEKIEESKEKKLKKIVETELNKHKAIFKSNKLDALKVATSIFATVGLVGVVSTIIACENKDSDDDGDALAPTDPIELQAPKLSIDIDLKIATWNNIDNAKSYVVRVTKEGDETTFDTVENSFYLSSLTVGDYIIQVKAVSDDIESEWSDASSGVYTVEETTVLEMNSPKINGVDSNNVVTWESVDDATVYFVMVDGDTTKTYPTRGNECNFDLNIFNLSVGKHFIQVKAVNRDESNNIIAESEFGEKFYFDIKGEAPKVSIDEANEYINWNSTTGADKYIVSILKVSVGETPKLFETVENKFDLSILTKGVYGLQVKVVVGEVESDWSGLVEYYCGTKKLATPEIKVDNNNGYVYWNKIENTQKYHLQISVDAGDKDGIVEFYYDIEQSDKLEFDVLSEFKKNSIDANSCTIYLQAVGDGDIYGSSDICEFTYNIIN